MCFLLGTLREKQTGWEGRQPEAPTCGASVTRCHVATAWLVGGQPASQLLTPAHVKTPSLSSNTVPTTLWGQRFCCYCCPFQVGIPTSFSSLEAFRTLSCRALPHLPHWGPVGQHHPRSESGSSPPSRARPCGQERGNEAAFPLSKPAGFSCL